jgi:hypothetical protein
LHYCNISENHLYFISTKALILFLATDSKH